MNERRDRWRNLKNFTVLYIFVLRRKREDKVLSDSVYSEVSVFPNSPGGVLNLNLFSRKLPRRCTLKYVYDVCPSVCKIISLCLSAKLGRNKKKKIKKCFFGPCHRSTCEITTTNPCVISVLLTVEDAPL